MVFNRILGTNYYILWGDKYIIFVPYIPLMCHLKLYSSTVRKYNRDFLYSTISLQICYTPSSR